MDAWMLWMQLLRDEHTVHSHGDGMQVSQESKHRGRTLLQRLLRPSPPLGAPALCLAAAAKEKVGLLR